MKFYDRETELELLRNERELSKEVSRFTIMIGRRRIGKTALVKESEKGNKFLYFYVPRNSESLICDDLAAAVRKDLGITMFHSGRFRDLFEQLMVYGQNNNFTFMIDEFQELERANKAITSHMQNLWDMYKGSARINLIVCGSVQSMMVKIFQNYKEPLFGRATSIFSIDPFEPSVVKTILRDHNPNYRPDDLLFLYTVTGGVPKYIELLMDTKATTFDKMLDRICSPLSLFLSEGKDLLISEFGKDYGTYFSILKLISKGKTALNEINTSIGMDCSPYLDKLDREYNIVKRTRPIFSKENSRDVRWKITDNYLRFYFRLIDSNQPLIEMGYYDLLKRKIIDDYPQYSGLVLEDYFRKKIIEETKLTKMGSHWDKKGENEIDIIALNDLGMKATVAEVKRDPKKADLKQLRERAEALPELRGFETEYRLLSLKDM
jgi:AAA+ ATPase superfamily predicted ATPase